MHPDPQRQSRTPEPSARSGLVLLDELGALRFEGADVSGFLQGYLTTDTADLAEGPQFTALCNIKGRVLCTGYAWLEEGAVTLVLHRSLCAAVLEFLRPYLMFSKTGGLEIPRRVIGVLGMEPPREFASLPGGRLDGERHLFAIGDSASASLLDRSADTAPGARIAGAPELDRNRWHEALIERREVWLQTATSGRFLPQMLGLAERGAVSFSKGCYLGQEVVARAQHRGKVKRTLTALDWSGAAPAPGTALEAGGRDAGVVVAAAGSASAGRALAVLVRDRPGPFASDRSATRFRLQT